MTDRDAVIVGGGPAGCAAAIALCRGGARPLLIERNAGPVDKVCGDFLGADALALLAGLGIDPLRLGGVPVRTLRLFHGRQRAEAALPFAAAGLSRRTLDAALLQAAGAAGAELAVGQAARGLARDGSGWSVQAGTTVRAGAVFLGTGKHDLRGLPRAGTAGGAIGLKAYLDLRMDGAVELTLFPGGYAGLQPTDQGAALCVAVTRAAFRASGGTWASLLAAIGSSCSAFAERAGGAPSGRVLAVAGVPYGFVYRDSGDGVFRLGDQAAVIPSLTGDGMAIALHTGAAAAGAWLGGGDAAAHHRALGRAIRGQMRLAVALHRGFLSPLVQAAVVAAAGWVPALPRLAARWTRVSAAGGLAAPAAPERATAPI